MDRGTVALLFNTTKKILQSSCASKLSTAAHTAWGYKSSTFVSCGKSDCSGTDEEQVPTGRICSTCEDLKNSQEN